MPEPYASPTRRSVATESRGEPTQPDTKFLQEIHDNFQRAFTNEMDNRNEMLEDMKFRAGEQWPTEVASEREGDRRPMLTINRIPQFVKQVTGDVRLNNPSIKVRAVDDEGDPEIAKIYQGMIRDIEQKSQSSVVYATGADNQVSCGKGWWRVITQYAGDDTFDQEIRLERIRSAFSVYCDPKATRLDGSDANWLFFCEWMEKADFDAAYPDAAPVDFMKPDSNQETLIQWTRNNRVRVAEYWKKVPRFYTLGLLSDGTTRNLTESGARDDAAAAGMEIVAERRVETYEIRMWKVNGKEVLEGGKEGKAWAGRYIPFVAATGEEVFVDERTVLHGLVRFAKDPQRLYNYWRSASAETIALAPKAPYLATPKQLQGHRNQWDSAHVKNHPYLLYTPDDKAPGPPQRQTLRDIPIEMFQEAGFASEDMKATTGIYDASLGAQSRETSGVAITRREAQGDVGTFVYIDNLSNAIEHTGRILVDLIPRIYDTEQTVRLLGEDGETYEAVKINEVMTDANGQVVADPNTKEPRLKNDLSVGKYDVRVQTGPSFTTRRQEAADSMSNLVRSVPQSWPVIGDLLVKNMDWPGADEIAARLRRVAEQGGFVEPEEVPEGEEPPAPKEPTQAELMQIQAAIAQLENLQSETAKNFAAAEKSLADAQKSQVETATEAAQMAVQEMAPLIMANVAQALAEMLRQPQAPPGNGGLPNPNQPGR